VWSVARLPQSLPLATQSLSLVTEPLLATFAATVRLREATRHLLPALAATALPARSHPAASAPDHRTAAGPLRCLPAAAVCSLGRVDHTRRHLALPSGSQDRKLRLLLDHSAGPTPPPLLLLLLLQVLLGRVVRYRSATAPTHLGPFPHLSCVTVGHPARLARPALHPRSRCDESDGRRCRMGLMACWSARVSCPSSLHAGSAQLSSRDAGMPGDGRATGSCLRSVALS
jgi:hypothetical protein